jgi:hypothetical protein
LPLFIRNDKISIEEKTGKLKIIIDANQSGSSEIKNSEHAQRIDLETHNENITDPRVLNS